MRPTQPLEPPLRKRRRFRIFHRREAQITQPEPTQGQQYKAEQNFWSLTLQKQQTLNIFTLLGVIAAAAAFVVLYCTLRESRKQTRSVSQQAQTAQQEFELSERPWLSINPIALTDFIFDKSGNAHFGITFLIKNTGHSPAAYVHIEWGFVLVHPGGDFVRHTLNRQKEMCELLRGHEKPDLAPFTLFPGDQTTKTTGTSLSAGNIKTGEYPAERGLSAFIQLFVVGCIDYRFEFQNSRQHHQTGFAYSLYKWQITRRGLITVIHVGENVPRNMLRLDPFAFGDAFYAD